MKPQLGPDRAPCQSGCFAGNRSANINIAVARAAFLVADGDAPTAFRIVALALAGTPPDYAGWLVPIELLLSVQRERPAWAAVLATLAQDA